MHGQGRSGVGVRVGYTAADGLRHEGREPEQVWRRDFRGDKIRERASGGSR